MEIPVGLYYHLGKGNEMEKAGRKTYESPMIERVPLVAEEAVLYACKCVGPQISGPPQGFCSGYFQESCSNVAS